MSTSMSSKAARKPRSRKPPGDTLNAPQGRFLSKKMVQLEKATFDLRAAERIVKAKKLDLEKKEAFAQEIKQKIEDLAKVVKDNGQNPEFFQAYDEYCDKQSVAASSTSRKRRAEEEQTTDSNFQNAGAAIHVATPLGSEDRPGWKGFIERVIHNPSELAYGPEMVQQHLEGPAGPSYGYIQNSEFEMPTNIPWGTGNLKMTQPEMDTSVAPTWPERVESNQIFQGFTFPEVGNGFLTGAGPSGSGKPLNGNHFSQTQ